MVFMKNFPKKKLFRAIASYSASFLMEIFNFLLYINVYRMLFSLGKGCLYKIAKLQHTCKKLFLRQKQKTEKMKITPL